MTIDAVAAIGQSLSTGTQEPSGFSINTAPNQADVDLFQSSFNQASNGAMSLDGNGISGFLSEKLNQYTSSFGELSLMNNKNLLAAAANPTPMNILEANRTLSEFSLKGQLMAKTISQGVRALDKLTTLQ